MTKISQAHNVLCHSFTYTNNLVLGTSGKVETVGAEANTPDVQITVLGKAAILEMRNRVSGLDVEDLGRAIATGRYTAAIKTKTHTADHTLMRKVVNEVNVQNSSRTRIEDCEPIATLLLQVLW
jgi:hypothetical protein